jgi:FAD/FMN-containing dehydrogenase
MDACISSKLPYMTKRFLIEDDVVNTFSNLTSLSIELERISCIRLHQALLLQCRLERDAELIAAVAYVISRHAGDLNDVAW